MPMLVLVSNPDEKVLLQIFKFTYLILKKPAHYILLLSRYILSAHSNPFRSLGAGTDINIPPGAPHGHH